MTYRSIQMKYSDMEFDDLETPTLVLLLREARLERKELQAKEYKIRQLINARSGVKEPDHYPRRDYKKLSTSEILEIGRMSKQHIDPKVWVDYIETIINK